MRNPFYYPIHPIWGPALLICGLGLWLCFRDGGPLNRSAFLSNRPDKKGVTPLHGAAALGFRKLAERLLKSGADVDVRADDGATPLHWAALKGQKEVAELLLAHKADVNATDKNGHTPLRNAVDSGHTSVADLLRQNGGH
jgi:ankyrin repeat protein